MIKILLFVSCLFISGCVAQVNTTHTKGAATTRASASAGTGAAGRASGASGTAHHRHCNLFVIHEMQKRGIHLPSSSANAIDVHLKNSRDWRQIPRLRSGRLDHAAAHNAARRNVVLVSYNSGSSRSGHVAIVEGRMPMGWSNSFNANVPHASGPVRGSRPKTVLLSFQFAANKEPRMNYFVYTR